MLVYKILEADSLINEQQLNELAAKDGDWWRLYLTKDQTATFFILKLAYGGGFQQIKQANRTHIERRPALKYRRWYEPPRPDR